MLETSRSIQHFILRLQCILIRLLMYSCFHRSGPFFIPQDLYDTLVISRLCTSMFTKVVSDVYLVAAGLGTMTY